MKGVHCETEIISQLTTFGPLNFVDSMYQTFRIFLVTSSIPPYMPPDMLGTNLKHATSYNRLFLQ